MPFLRVLALNLYCDCSIIPFWNWLNIVGKHESTITCFERNGAFLPSLPSCAFDKCNGTVCPDNFCTNGGTCFVNSFGDPTCLCPGDWTGAKCNVHPCHNNPCGLNGLCEIDGYQTATCQCYGNWTGQFCERSPCHTQVCSQSMCYYNDTGASICLNLHDSECTGKVVC
ncbi:uncharacterized protein LOC143043393 [Mytilus galloprovincialis]|uniref:uncharacterized protein LOC143043393 n=1 Tax=Mytilus galloprovincialis TaxID=29158 RepID=UPI003F7C0B03